MQVMEEKQTRRKSPKASLCVESYRICQGDVKRSRFEQQQGMPVEIIEDDGDKTIVAQLEKILDWVLKCKLDRNHYITNIVKILNVQRNKQEVSLSNQVIQHLHNCIKYIFSKNNGDVDGMRDNLKALIRHQFVDHSFCHHGFVVTSE